MQLLPRFSVSVFWSCVPKFSFLFILRRISLMCMKFCSACKHTCMYMYVCARCTCVNMLVNKHAGMHMHVNSWECWHHISFSIILHFYLQREGLSLTSELDPGFPVSTSWALVLQMGCYACLDFLWVLERWTTGLPSKCFIHRTISLILEVWFWTACKG